MGSVSFTTCHTYRFYSAPSRTTTPKSLLNLELKRRLSIDAREKEGLKRAIPLLKTSAGNPSFLVLPLVPQCRMSYMGIAL